MILLQFGLLTVMNSTGLNNDLINERFYAAREFYEAQWHIQCPVNKNDPVTDDALPLCLILDTRFQQLQTCNWWKQQETVPAQQQTMLLEACLTK